jgi:RNA polymerase sigma-70 factor, ECF subfamily
MGGTTAVSPDEVTALLHSWRDGDAAALDELIPLVYDELHGIARRHLRGERAGHTLQTTALVHEACLRLMGPSPVDWQGRVHFYAVAARVMRRLLVDHARSRRGPRRGGEGPRLPLDGAAAPERGQDLVELDDALERLAALDPRKSRIVELRYFGGLSVDETAEVLGVSAITIKREWPRIKAWLYRELAGGGPDDGGGDGDGR